MVALGDDTAVVTAVAVVLEVVVIMREIGRNIAFIIQLVIALGDDTAVVTAVLVA